MAHKQTTLDSAGYTYDPFTESSIWGAPPQLMMPCDGQQELPLGADDSAMPRFTQGALTNSGPRQGSVQSEVYEQPEVAQADTKKIIMLVGFIAVIGLALYSKR